MGDSGSCTSHHAQNSTKPSWLYSCEQDIKWGQAGFEERMGRECGATCPELGQPPHPIPSWDPGGEFLGPPAPQSRPATTTSGPTLVSYRVFGGEGSQQPERSAELRGSINSWQVSFRVKKADSWGTWLPEVNRVCFSPLINRRQAPQKDTFGSKQHPPRGIPALSNPTSGHSPRKEPEEPLRHQHTLG